MHDHPETLSGPDFLDAIADAESGEGRHINGHAYRERAKQWRQDQQALEKATNAQAELERRLDTANKALAA